VGASSAVITFIVVVFPAPLCPVNELIMIQILRYEDKVGLIYALPNNPKTSPA